jgi:hypothetical protein
VAVLALVERPASSHVALDDPPRSELRVSGGLGQTSLRDAGVRCEELERPATTGVPQVPELLR